MRGEATRPGRRLQRCRKSTFIALVLAPLLPGSVVIKTVFSHPSKLDLLDEAHARGYTP